MRYNLKTHEMTSFLPGFSAAWLSFTEDGLRMAYVSFPGGTIWQSKVDGTDRHQLTFPPIGADIPRWSPDGSQIAFMGGEPGRPTQIFSSPQAKESRSRSHSAMRTMRPRPDRRKTTPSPTPAGVGRTLIPPITCFTSST
jgi:hypothetical protein